MYGRWITYGVAIGFVTWVVPDGKIRMVEGFFATNTPGRVKAKHSREEVDCERIGLREQGGEGNPRSDRQRTNVILRLQKREVVLST